MAADALESGPLSYGITNSHIERATLGKTFLVPTRANKVIPILGTKRANKVVPIICNPILCLNAAENDINSMQNFTMSPASTMPVGSVCHPVYQQNFWAAPVFSKKFLMKTFSKMMGMGSFKIYISWHQVLEPFQHYWPFARVIYRSPVDCIQKGQLMMSCDTMHLLFAWTSCWATSQVVIIISLYHHRHYHCYYHYH